MPPPSAPSRASARGFERRRPEKDTSANPCRIRELLQLGHRIAPAYHSIAQPYVVGGKHVLIVRAPGGQTRPYKSPSGLGRDNREYVYWIRRGSATVKAGDDEQRELFGLAAKVPFDDRLSLRATVADLKLPLVQSFLRDVQSDLQVMVADGAFEEVCHRMLIVDGPPEDTRPRNIGLMFFSERPDRFFPQTQIDVVEMPDGPGGDRLIEKTFVGPLSQMLRDALHYLNVSVLKEYVVKHPDRAEADRFVNYPYAALEELLVNAVYHRSYEEREPIEVRVLPDHITITSYPGLDRSIRTQDLAGGSFVARRYRNRRIGEFLKELRLTEGRGTGIPKAMRAMRRNGSPPLRFDTDEDRTYFTATLPIHTSVAPLPRSQLKARIKNTPEENTPEENTPEEPRRKNGGARQVVTTRRREVLQYCISPRDRASIQARFALKDADNLRLLYLTPLLREGLLAMTDPEHPNIRTQKYKTTEKGQEYLREPKNG